MVNIRYIDEAEGLRRVRMEYEKRGFGLRPKSRLFYQVLITNTHLLPSRIVRPQIRVQRKFIQWNREQIMFRVFKYGGRFHTCAIYIQ